MPFQGNHVFFSYSRKDDLLKDAHGRGWVEQFRDHLVAAHRRRTGKELRVFFDKDGIDNGERWKLRLLSGMRSSRLFLAFMSPNYVRSPNCRWEWREFARREHMQARGADGMMSIYFQPVPGAPGMGGDPELQRITDELAAENLMEDWLHEMAADLHARQAYTDPVEAGRHARAHFDLRSWFRHGPQALAELDAAERLDDLRAHPRAAELDLPTLAERIDAIAHRIARRADRCLLAELAPGNMDRSYAHFVGRHQELAAVHDALVGGAAGLITTVHGLGGMGKTALAVQYAHAYAEHYAAGGRWIIPCEGITDMAKALRSLIKPLGIDENTLPKEDERKAAQAIIEHLRLRTEEGRGLVLTKLGEQEDLLSGEATLPAEWRPRALLIFDNVDHAALLAAKEVALLPQAEWLEYIVTTRLPAARFASAGDKQMKAVTVESLPLQDALALIREFQPGQVFPSAAYEAGAHALVRALGGFTLAVEMAGAYLGLHPEIDPHAYLNSLEAQGLEHIEDVRSAPVSEQIRYERLEAAQVGCIRYILETSIAQFVLAYAHLPHRSEAIEHVLDAASVFPPELVLTPALKLSLVRIYPEYLREESSVPDRWSELWRALCGMRLLQPMESGGVVRADVEPTARMHRLVGSVWRKLAGTERIAQARERVVTELEAFAMQLQQEWDAEWRWTNWRYILASVIVHLQETGPPDIRLSQLLFLVARMEAIMGEQVVAGDLYERAFEEVKSYAAGKENDPDVIRLLTDAEGSLGDFLRHRGGWGDRDRAQTLMESSLQRRESLFLQFRDAPGAIHALVVGLAALGTFWSSDHVGDTGKAMSYLTRALDLCEDHVDRHPASSELIKEQQVILTHLGNCHLSLEREGNQAHALECYRRSLKLGEAFLAANGTSAEAIYAVASTLCGLAAAHQILGPEHDLLKSLAYLDRALKLRKELLAAHPDSSKAAREVAHALERVGVVHIMLNTPKDHDLAVHAFESAVNLREQLYETDRGEFAAGQELWLALHKLGDAYDKRAFEEDMSRRLVCIERTAEIIKQLLSGEPSSEYLMVRTVANFMSLAEAYRSRNELGDDERAVRSFRTAVGIGDKLHREHPNSEDGAQALLHATGLFGLFLRERNADGDLQEAIACYTRVLYFEQRAARVQPDSVETLYNTGATLYTLGDLYTALATGDGETNALACYNASRTVNEKLLNNGVDRPGIWHALYLNYWKIYRWYSRNQESEHASQQLPVIHSLLTHIARVYPDHMDRRMREGLTALDEQFGALATPEQPAP